MLLEGTRKSDSSAFRIISCGRLLNWKGFDLGLRAFSRVQNDFPNCQYDIVGDGPERGNLERLAATLGIADKVRFLGGLPQAEVFAQFKESDVLLHPSLHDSSGWVCVEAMAAGCPVVCLDWAGPGVLVGDDTGIKVSPRNRAAAVRGLAEALRRLARDTSLRTTMAAAAVRRVKAHFLSERKADSLSSLYQAALEENLELIPTTASKIFPSW